MARFYGFNPWGGPLTDVQRRLLEASLPGVWAEEVLRERAGELTAAAIRSLTLVATGDPFEAERAFNRRVLADLRAGRTPEV